MSPIALNAAVPKGVTAYVKRHFPEYEYPQKDQFEKMWVEYVKHEDKSKKVPWIVRADFDGDKEDDYALILKKKGENKFKFISVHSKKGKFSHYRILDDKEYKEGRTIDFGFYLEPPGLIKEYPLDSAREMVQNGNPGITMYLFEQSSVYIYWKYNKYKTLWTSD